MKLRLGLLHMFVFIILLSCVGNGTKTNATEQPIAKNVSATSNETQQSVIIGEWEQQYTCFDKNGNYKLEPDEKIPSNTRLGFDWFRFNADGSCLRDKDVKFKATYEIQDKGITRKLLIQGGDNLRYTIIELTEKELILGANGSFIVFRRIN